MIAQRATAMSSLTVRPDSIASAGAKAEMIGLLVVRYSLVLVLVWIGAMKFTA